MDNISDKIATYAPPPGEFANVNIPVEAGEIIGIYSGSIDYNIVDEQILIQGFIQPESYESEPWKIHTPDPFDYFNESIRIQMLQKCLRTTKPEGGKIDYDIDGRLVGNWFKENTNGYAGIDQEQYWVGHLAIVYDWIDADHIIISLGSYEGKPRQFAVAGNSPNPANVSVETGLVQYELVEYDYFLGNECWNREDLIQGLEVKNSQYIHGVVLFQLIEDERLQVEIIPGGFIGKSDGFSENAEIYTR
jgi:hypothetical protein